MGNEQLETINEQPKLENQPEADMKNVQTKRDQPKTIGQFRKWLQKV